MLCRPAMFDAGLDRCRSRVPAVLGCKGSAQVLDPFSLFFGYYQSKDGFITSAAELIDQARGMRLAAATCGPDPHDKPRTGEYHNGAHTDHP